MRVVCECGACIEIQPHALVLLVGWKMTLEDLAPRMRCSRCGRRQRRLSQLRGPSRAECLRIPIDRTATGGISGSFRGLKSGGTGKPPCQLFGASSVYKQEGTLRTTHGLVTMSATLQTWDGDRSAHRLNDGNPSESQVSLQQALSTLCAIRRRYETGRTAD